MMTSDELERQLEHVRSHQEAEPAFFRSLLEATVYAHVPLSDDHRRVRFLQFRHPDGFDALPFFTSESKAVFAARSAARIVACRGRELLKLTRGATLMLNPNDAGCVLYPEEIDALLTTGMVARIEKSELPAGQSLLMDAAADPPTWLVQALTQVYAGLPRVEVAYLIETRAPEQPDTPNLLIVIAVAPEHAERAARASITALQSAWPPPPCPVDLTVFDPAQGMPDYLRDSEVAPFYMR